MNVTVINLAIQTIALLKSSDPENYDVPETGKVSKYFEKLGVQSEDTVREYHLFRKRFVHTVHRTDTSLSRKAISDELCQEINALLRYNEKVYLLLMVQDCLLDIQDESVFSEHLNHIFNAIGIDSSLIVRLRKFLEQNDPADVNTAEYLLLAPLEASMDESLEGRWIENNSPRQKEDYSVFQAEGFTSHILVMFVDQIKSYIVRCMAKNEQLFDQDNQQQCRFRLLEPGNELSLKGIPILTYSDLKSRFLQHQEKRKLTLVVDHVQYKSARMTKEVNTFTAVETTGQLIGIVGNEGVGKSTLLKLLAGKLKPDSGSITINGYDLWKNKYLLKGTIGYVPEEDLLYEELTVADNLLLTARLYYSNNSRKELDARVNGILSKMDILELKHVVVGSVLSKHIQPGQRRMINIALELLREPQILLVDNALSGLGMADASKVIKILHDYSFSGNLVITPISQSDTSTFRFFDKIWILDEGGRAVYNGPVKAAPEYLSRHLNIAFQDTQDVDPSGLLDMVNYKLPDREDNVWRRVKEPKEWHDLYLREQILKSNGEITKSLLPARMLKIPNLEIQLLIFSIRNFKCKFSRLNDIILALITGPAVALLLALLFRTRTGGVYIFSLNENIPLFQFLSVVLSIFLGLVLSAGEILKEKNMLEKEEYLEFSRFSYINSKILYLFPVIALQTLLYIWTSNSILGIRDMLWAYWMVLFSCACFGILLGLFLSASGQSSDILYKRMMPLVITLQLLLGGGIIPYDRMNLGTGKYTPVLGDLMVSRWGFEALAVKQYTGNRYQKMVYESDRKISLASYYSLYVVPKLQETLARYIRASDNKDSLDHYAALLKNEMIKMNVLTDVFPFEYMADLPNMKNNENLAQETSDYLTYLSLHFYQQHENMIQKKKRMLDSLNTAMGKGVLESIKRDHDNAALENRVVNKNSGKPYTMMGDEMIRNKDNIFQEPSSNLGRACLFCPFKQLHQQRTDTIWFNLSMIWLFTATCYLLVLFDAGALIRKIRKA
jgi:ABC-type multidrug transport system ATPase subunit